MDEASSDSADDGTSAPRPNQERDGATKSVDGSIADEPDADDREGDEPATRVWLVERTYSDDELNIVILVYATEDGTRYHRRERALSSFTGPARETKASLLVSPDSLGTVDDPETRERYATEASRMAERHDPDESV